jgi:hypothetical protein
MAIASSAKTFYITLGRVSFALVRRLFVSDNNLCSKHGGQRYNTSSVSIFTQKL